MRRNLVSNKTLLSLLSINTLHVMDVELLQSEDSDTSALFATTLISARTVRLRALTLMLSSRSDTLPKSPKS